MAARKKRKRQEADPPRRTQASTPPPPPPENRVAFVFALLALISTVIVVWLVPRMTGDTFMMLAGGRDLFAGKLGKPDDWSFMSEDRVWINQSWGTGLLLYVVHGLIGNVGIVAIKAVLIGLLTAAQVFSARRFGVSYTVAMLVTAFSVNSAKHFIDMRANLVGLAFLAILIWLLYWSQGRPHRIWLAVAFITVWANMHGSFIFGIGMLALWTITNYAILWWTRAGIEERDKLWTLPIATIAALVLSAITSPFGISNLIQPFTLMSVFQKEKWPLPAIEMRNVFDPRNQRFGGLRGYFILIGLLTAPLAVWYLQAKKPILRKISDINRQRAVVLAFTVVLVCVAVAMATLARRFIPIALIISTPLVAYEFQWLLSHRWFAWPTAVLTPTIVALGSIAEKLQADWVARSSLIGLGQASVDLRKTWPWVTLAIFFTPIVLALLVALARSTWENAAKVRPAIAAAVERMTDPRRVSWAACLIAIAVFFESVQSYNPFLLYYSQNHTHYPDYPIFERMIVHHQFPDGPAKFLNDNEISGRVLNDWRWESFLRWHCPQVKVYLGGRSRQVYSSKAAINFARASAVGEPRELAAAGVQLVVAPLNQQTKLQQRILLFENFPWDIIYVDQYSFVAASRNDPKVSGLIEDVVERRLIYPSTSIQKNSIAVNLLTRNSHKSRQDILAACIAANEAEPLPLVYALLDHKTNEGKIPASWLLSYFEKEMRRLETVDYHRTLGAFVLSSRTRIARILARRYRDLGRNESEKFWTNYVKQVTLAGRALANGKPEPPIEPIPPLTGQRQAVGASP